MNFLAEKKRLVIKIGSALLVDPSKGAVRQEWLETLCEDIHAAHRAGQEIIIVSSGAVALARHQMGPHRSRLKLGEKQALASIGQIGIAHAWQQAFKRHNLTIGQLLLTPEDTEDRQRHLNARRTLESILRLRALPVINENDVIATEALRFGDNDRLAARITQMIGADTLILFSDIDGLYTADPRTTPTATHIPRVQELTDEIMSLGGDAPPGDSSGGMRTKLLAAQITTRAGSDMIITRGDRPHPLAALQSGALHTHFLAHDEVGSARKRWIASTLHPEGTITLDAGAVDALHKGASLLSVGITDIEGDFDDGAVVTLSTPSHKILGRGLTDHSADDIRLMLISQATEHHSQEHHNSTVIIHRNNLSLD
ncbi:glutamate 5-kinase [Saccharibacter sp. 17.LH.SD]|uniref:glutamate 5-kinase n=1 Tax=Saccharibacter sp. 17.LH.SD TaxID=2689393 RepID=UPI00136B74B4|nr:glutamate 5-kinase [Saccharibacter sp. 17.LH.SD]MXV44648.1 glutamate 5-kinase [Saccharibacter sp. 17.LH.SD]